MKKVLFFAAMLCGFMAINAQDPIGLLYNGQCYQNGQSVVVILDRDAHSCSSIGFRNQTSDTIRGVVASMTEEDVHGVEAWGMCTGDQCVPTLTSAPFDLPASLDYNNFIIDLSIEDIEYPSSLYTLTLRAGFITCSWDVLFQAYNEDDTREGINDVVAQSSVSVYPNPAQGQVNVRYNAQQPCTLVVYDAQGRTISQQTICGNGTTAISNLPAGIYAYGIAGSKMHKLIVK